VVNISFRTTQLLLAISAEIKYNIGMKRKRCVFLPFILLLLLISADFLGAQESPQVQYARRFQNGTQLYKLSRFQEAAIEFRRAQEIAANVNDKSASLYWVILSQLAYSDFGSAIRDMKEKEKTAPNSPYTRDMLYHRGRVYYNQGYFEEALYFLNRYNQSVTDVNRQSADRRAASFFWMGECLYAMGQLEEAEKFYAWVIAKYTESPKVEAASYRIDLIKQKKIESELLALLQWSHEEALRTSEDYQRTIRTYEYTLNMYQRRIAELSNNENLIINMNNQELIPNGGQRQVIEEIPLPEKEIQEPEGPEYSYNDYLIERARQLGSNVQEILNNNEAGGP
jgi:tetratricopeptide (TPR) repeat protein